MKLKDILKRAAYNYKELPTKEYQEYLNEENILRKLDFNLLNFIRGRIKEIKWIEPAQFLRFQEPHDYAVARKVVDSDEEHYISFVLKIKKRKDLDYFIWYSSQEDFIEEDYEEVYNTLIERTKKKIKNNSRILKFPSLKKETKL